jgi:three-Cys-motif partner protein
MSKKNPTIWNADPHTIAKIEILKGYLAAWIRILGSTRRDETILYVDGFAGPGRYLNHNEGSPVAAVRVVRQAITELGPKFIAGAVQGAFIESDSKRFAELSNALDQFPQTPSAPILALECGFEEGMKTLRSRFPGPFNGEGPLFVFVDPFGATDVPFATIARCMESDTAEVLINLDADGAARIHLAKNNNRDNQLTDLFGTDLWRDALKGPDIGRMTLQILDLYKEQLRSIPGVRFVWSFAMRGGSDSLNYHLVFASKHPLGLGKMKEAMRSIDKTGFYAFSDAHIDQHVLFREDDSSFYAATLFQKFDGQSVTSDEVNVFALTETPFLNAKTMLALLERQQRLKVEMTPGCTRRTGDFPDDKIETLLFGKFGEHREQVPLL